MSETRPSMEAETTALKKAYAAFNQNDFHAFGEIFDPQIEWMEPAEFPGGGTYRGRDVVLAHLATARQTWAEGSCQPQRIIVVGNRIVQLIDVHVRLKHETEWRDGQVAEVYTFRDGKVIQVRIFGDSREALDWAGANQNGTGE